VKERGFPLIAGPDGPKRKAAVPTDDSPQVPSSAGPGRPPERHSRSEDEDGTLLLDDNARTKEIDKSRHGKAHPAASPTETLAPTLSGDSPVPCVPGFALLELLGEGSFGKVWKARDLSNGKTVAIKFFTHGASNRWQVLLEEVQHHAQLDAVRGIVDLKKAVAQANPPYYIMAYADNGSLAGRLASGPLPAAQALDLFTQAAEALAYVHAKGICHCDFKPGNVLLDARGRALLADFGQAHLSTDDSPALGTFFFMAPEQATLADQIVPDPRWDVYGLGAVLYAMLTGKPPRFDEKVLEELVAIADLGARLTRYQEWIARAPAPANHRRVKSVDADLAAIIDRCLEIDPARRPHDAGAVLALLRHRRRRQRQRPMLWIGMTASLLALSITTLAAVRSKNVAVDTYQRQLTEQQLDSNLTSASIVASAVQSQLLGRLSRVEATATQELHDALKRHDRPALEAMLTRLMSSDGRPTGRFAETTVSNDRGELVGMVRLAPGQPRTLTPLAPGARKTRFAHYSWRDWFSGTGDRYEEADRLHPPIRAPHVSDPYVSSMAAEDLFISISVPILDPSSPKAKPAGVLEGAVRLQELSHWLRQARIGRHGFAVLLDRRGHCVLHADPAFRPEFGKRPRRFFSEQEEKRLFPDPMGTIASYRDPVMQRDFMAGYAKMTDPRIGWVALVQHDRTEMLAPVATLREQLDWIGVQSFVLVALLTGGLWGWLFWMLRRSEHLGDG
jgi:serine/threonine protein kinase